MPTQCLLNFANSLAMIFDVAYLQWDSWYSEVSDFVHYISINYTYYNLPLRTCEDRETLINTHVRSDASDRKGLERHVVFVCECVAFDIYMLPVAMCPLGKPAKTNLMNILIFPTFLSFHMYSFSKMFSKS